MEKAWWRNDDWMKIFHAWIHVLVSYQTEILVFAHNLSSENIFSVFPTGMQFLVCHLFIGGFWFVFYNKEFFLDLVFF